jgi:ketopantoate hydroxymethyltransferase
MELVEDCLEVERAGASAVVLEMVVSEVAQIISKLLKIPTIGIGSGAGVDGQVLVYHDLLGLLRFVLLLLRGFLFEERVKGWPQSSICKAVCKSL